MEMFSTRLPGGEGLARSRECAVLSVVGRKVGDRLSVSRRELTEQVTRRAVATGLIMGLRGEALARLEGAARIHRLGEVFLHGTFGDKCFDHLTPDERKTYRSYPIYSAMRVAESVSSPVYEMLLRHRELVHGDDFLKSGRVAAPLASRILCAATEYEERVQFANGDLHEIARIEADFAGDNGGRYDPRVVDALLGSITAEHVVH